MNWRLTQLSAPAVLTLAGLATAARSQAGPDALYINLTSTIDYGSINGIRAYMLDTQTCNMGDENLLWGTMWDGTPAVGMNAYRLAGGRLTQIGLSFARFSCCAAASSGCSLLCNGASGFELGSGCREVNGAAYNGLWTTLGLRSSVNAFSGEMIRNIGGTGNAIYKRLQIHESDITPASNPGALYFFEGVYVATGDSNPANNASHRRITFNSAYSVFLHGSMQAGVSAIYAWRDHGLGLGVPDPRVEIVEAHIPGEGIFHVASKATDLGAGDWRYDYAVFNLNSDRSCGNFTVAIPAGAIVAGVGFQDVNYHSGELYANDNWTVAITADAVTWSSPETFQQNPNSNALRWGTMYNFWFETNAPPAPGPATLGLFKPGTPGEIAVTLHAVPGRCHADFDGDGFVTGQDFEAFVTAFEAGNTGADFNDDGFVTGEDFDTFVTAFEAGC